MPEEININKIEWTALEYNHKEHPTDWYWAVGLITLAVGIAAVWMKNYLFAVFVIISGATLALFSLRHPPKIIFSIETEGLFMGKYKYLWGKIKGFDIKKRDGQYKLLIEIDKYFLPVYTIPIPNEIVEETKTTLLKIVPRINLKESESMLFVEKLGL